MNKNLSVALIILIGMLAIFPLISASTREVQVWNGSDYITTEEQYDSGCITTWECKNGVAVKSEWINPTITKYGQEAIDMGYKNVPGEYCYADPKTKPDCNVQEVKEIETVTPESKQEIKRSFCQKLFSWFTGNGFK